MNWANDNVVVLTLIACVALIVITVVVVGKYIKQIKTEKSTGELLDENWDGIEEYTNKIPTGWALAYIGTIIWALWYFLIGYPLGGFSQIGAYNEESEAHNARFESKWANPDDQTLQAMGEGVFLVQCSQCHGITGDGIGGKAADFTVWGTEAAIENVIINGSRGMNYPLGDMPAGLLDAQSAKAVAAYMSDRVLNMGTKNPDLVSTGEALWATCTACHGEDAKGMGGMSPDLTTYNKAEFVVDVLNRGKKGDIGNMPKFDSGLLSETQKLAVGKYVQSLAQH